MPSTTTKYSIARPDDNDFVNSWPLTMRTALNWLDTAIATVDATNPRPAASKFGRVHRHPTTGVISFDTGSAWVDLAVAPIALAALATDVPLDPVGTVIAYAGSALPGNGKWAWADGSLINRVTYAAYFAAVGHTYNGGVDPGSSLVRLPDKRGRASVGADQMPGGSAAGRLPNSNRARGQSGGEERHTLSVGEMPSHAHSSVGDLFAFTQGAAQTAAGGSFAAINGFAGATAASGGGTAHNVLQPYEVDNYLVRIA